MTDKAIYRGSCFCGAVELAVVGAPAAMGSTAEALLVHSDLEIADELLLRRTMNLTASELRADRRGRRQD